MRKTLWMITGAAVFLFFYSFNTASADEKTVFAESPEAKQGIKLRFYRGFRENSREPVLTVTASYLEPEKSLDLRPSILLAEEKQQIEKVFNLDRVELIGENDIVPVKGGYTTAFYRIEGKDYGLKIGRKKKDRFHILVTEKNGDKRTSLLDTEIILPVQKVAVFGFEDRGRKPYFISLNLSSRISAREERTDFKIEEKTSETKGISEGVKGGAVPGKAGGIPGQVQSGNPSAIEQSVRAVGEIKPPKLAVRADPVYPEEAREKKVEGMVIMEAVTNPEGKVVFTRILRGKDPYLNQAAMDAVRQWEYEPAVIDGEKKGIQFTVTVVFRLKKNEKYDYSGYPEEAVFLKQQRPLLIKKVSPHYPEPALQSGVEGSVEIQIMIDETGRPAKLRVVSSESTLFNQAALDAVRQWMYVPYREEGEPRPAVFHVTVEFKLPLERDIIPVS